MFWIQTGLWAIFGCGVMSKTVLGVFEKIEIQNFPPKHPKLFCFYLSNQISLRGHFVLKTNCRISSIPLYKYHCCSFFTSRVIKKRETWIFDRTCVWIFAFFLSVAASNFQSKRTFVQLFPWHRGEWRNTHLGTQKHTQRGGGREMHRSRWRNTFFSQKKSRNSVLFM